MASEPNDGGLHDEVKTVAVRIFGSREAAEIAAANLEAHGIASWIKADDCGGMYPTLALSNGVRLLVQVSDVAAAAALLDASASPAEIDQVEAEAIASAAPEVEPLKKPAPGQFLSGIVIGVILGIMLCLLYQSSNDLGTKKYYHYTHGKMDEEWIYQDGQLVEFLKDRNHDGAWDQWTYYERGKAVRSEYDNNFDGKPDEIWTFSNSISASLEKDTDFNGTPDLFCTYKYDIIQQADYRPNGSTFTTVREIFTNGVLSEVWRGGDSNGNFKEVIRYDPFFNPISTYIPIATPSLPMPFK